LQDRLPHASRRSGATSRPNVMDSPAVRAPDFPDTLDWIHTGGRRLTLADFRGKLLLLDFWTYG
jgi:cytochrome oxidase Cu insertion factor (SCO1/SenC/PrrC family)